MYDKPRKEIRITDIFVIQETKHLSAVRLCGSGGRAGHPVIRRMPVRFSVSPSTSKISKWKVTGSSNGRKVGNWNFVDRSFDMSSRVLAAVRLVIGSLLA